MEIKNTDFYFKSNTVILELRIMINQIWKILPMKENNENWQKQINLCILQLRGLQKIFVEEVYFLQILILLEGLFSERKISVFRQVIFKIINKIESIIKRYERIRVIESKTSYSWGRPRVENDKR